MEKSETKKIKKVKKIAPTIITTDNVIDELLSVAKTNKIKPIFLDFKIIEVQTYTRMLNEEQVASRQERSAEEISNSENIKFLLDKHFEITQKYKVEIFLRKTDNKLKNFKVAILTNKSKCKIYLKIDAGSNVEYYEEFKTDLEELINKSKIKAKILVNLFDKTQKIFLDKLAVYIKAKKEIKYEKAQTILVAEGYDTEPAFNDKLIHHHKNKHEIDENEKVDHASRDFMKSVEKDELIIEYIKPKDGKPGRNCHGDYIEVAEPVVNNEPKFTVDDESIETIEDENSILYKAINEGYVAFKSNTYSIDGEMDTGGLNFKTAGNISAGLDSHVTLNVKEKNKMNDAIGQGMVVEVTELNIDGHVGDKASITAKKASIGGQTHKTSILNVDNLSVETHKGTANGININITKLEHGIVNGEKVEIVEAIGGEIKAEDIKIDNCKSHVKASASKKIEILELNGSENIFKIDPLLLDTLNQDVEENKEKISELAAGMVKLNDEIQRYTVLVKDNAPMFDEISKKLASYKKQGIKFPNSLISQHQQLTKAQEYLKSIKDSHKTKEDECKLLTNKTASFQEDLFNARIINRDKWTDHNELIFKLIDPAIELSFKPKEGSTDMIFAVVKTEEDKFEIQAVEE
jgi:hypothetical protein